MMRRLLLSTALCAVTASSALAGGPQVPLQFDAGSAQARNVTIRPLGIDISIGVIDTVNNLFNPTLPASLNLWRPLDLVYDFHADPTGVVPADTAWSNLQAAMKAQNRRGTAPDGSFKFTSQLLMDGNGWPNMTGPQFECAGFYLTVFHVEGVTVSPQAMITTSGGSVGSPARSFHSRMRKCSIHGDTRNVTSGTGRTVFAIGRPDLADQINEGIFEVEVANSDGTNANAVTTQVNSVYNIAGFFVSNGGGSRTVGDAMQLVAAQMSSFSGSYSNAKNGIRLTTNGSGSTNDGYSEGNTFISTDMEEVKYDVAIDSAHATRNTFLGGKFSYSIGAINATAGSTNIVYNGTNSPRTDYGASDNFLVANTGLTVIFGSTIYPESGTATQTGSAQQTRNLISNGKTFQDSVATDGTSYHTNYASGAHDVASVQSGGSFDQYIAGSLVRSLSGSASTSYVNVAFGGNLISSVTAGTGASCTASSTCHNNAGRVTVGSGSPTTVTIAFGGSAYANTPVCTAVNETNNNALRPSSVSTTSVTFTSASAMSTSDKVTYTCFGL